MNTPILCAKPSNRLPVLFWMSSPITTIVRLSLATSLIFILINPWVNFTHMIYLHHLVLTCKGGDSSKATRPTKERVNVDRPFNWTLTLSVSPPDIFAWKLGIGTSRCLPKLSVIKKLQHASIASWAQTIALQEKNKTRELGQGWFQAHGLMEEEVWCKGIVEIVKYSVEVGRSYILLQL